MKRFFIGLSSLLALLLVIYLIHSFGFLGGLISTLLTGVAVYLVYNRIVFLQELNRYANMYEDVFVVSCHPRSGEIPEIEVEELEEFIVFCDYQDVIQTVEEEKYWLRKSGNMFFDQSLSVNQQLLVIPIIFQDGKHIAETWSDFPERVVKEIQTRRVLRHDMLKRADPDWYNKFGNLQRGVNWQKKY